MRRLLAMQLAGVTPANEAGVTIVQPTLLKSSPPYLEMHRIQAFDQLRPDQGGGGRAGHGIPYWESASLERSAQSSRLGDPGARLGARFVPAESSLRRRCGRPAHLAAIGLKACGRSSAAQFGAACARLYAPFYAGLGSLPDMLQMRRGDHRPTSQRAPSI